MASAVILQLVTGGFIFLVVFNFLPACIAWVDRHPDRRLLTGLNILSLFSFVLWFGLMVWAVQGRRPDSLIARWLADRQRRRLAVGGVMLSVFGLALASIVGTIGTLGPA